MPKGQLSLSMIFFLEEEEEEEEEGIIYLKMTGTFLAWGHSSTCSRFSKGTSPLPLPGRSPTSGIYCL